mmetsp:Transcript_17231/g.44901  ORF Transcript_17231/g.44901 Transcript_17231/m.44901 type:complete len:314 (-) Transcript_17231:209-1150(-)
MHVSHAACRKRRTSIASPHLSNGAAGSSAVARTPRSTPDGWAPRSADACSAASRSVPARSSTTDRTRGGHPPMSTPVASPPTPSALAARSSFGPPPPPPPPSPPPLRWLHSRNPTSLSVQTAGSPRAMSPSAAVAEANARSTPTRNIDVSSVWARSITGCCSSVAHSSASRPSTWRQSVLHGPVSSATPTVIPRTATAYSARRSVHTASRTATTSATVPTCRSTRATPSSTVGTRPRNHFPHAACTTSEGTSSTAPGASLGRKSRTAAGITGDRKSAELASPTDAPSSLATARRRKRATIPSPAKVGSAVWFF